MTTLVNHGPESRGSLLLVDDDAPLCDALARAFEKRGFEVSIALTEEQALRQIHDRPPQYAVVDLRLSGQPSLRLVAALVAMDPSTRIVVITGYGSITTAVEAIKLGATYYLCKPVDADEIVAAFHREPNKEAPPRTGKPMSIKRLEWEHICQVVQDCNGNISQAARALSMHRRTLQRKLGKRPVSK